MNFIRNEYSMFDNTETKLAETKLRRDIQKRLCCTVNTLEQIEHLTEKEIYELVSEEITDKMFAALMSVVLNYQTEDADKYSVGKKHIDVVKTFDIISKDLLRYGEENKLSRAGISDEELNLLRAEKKYCSRNVMDVQIFDIDGLPVRTMGSLVRAKINTIGDILGNPKKVANAKGIGKKAVDEINEAVQEVIDWYQVHPIAEISAAKKEECFDGLIDQICEGRDRRYVRAYLRNIKVNDCTVSYIVKTKFPDKNSEFVEFYKEEK